MTRKSWRNCARRSKAEQLRIGDRTDPVICIVVMQSTCAGAIFVVKAGSSFPYWTIPLSNVR
jgi:hypothetical protein